MSKIASSPKIGHGFSKPGIHSVTQKDGFYNLASEVREELLHYANWREMTQSGFGVSAVFSPHRQNGITTGHISERDRERLPQCVRFGEFLKQNLSALIPLVGLNSTRELYIESNARAYGPGAWLSPHTDSHTDERLAAWMLYLTAPDDGEWPAEKGGALRVWIPSGEEQRVHPRFNRFAMFRVHNDSFHEIEKIAWEPDWPHCRLALSGWIRGPQEVKRKVRKARMYMQSASAQDRNAELEATLTGSLAFNRLLVMQKTYCGLDASKAISRISQLEEDYRAHRNAPPGTSFLGYAPGPADLIIVVDEKRAIIHCRTSEKAWSRILS
jgi:Rps23 Pro-64 3,4-dihydroxylase Tpa1-like proline 4-hydroxylase